MQKKASQGRRLIAILKRKWMTYRDMLDTGISLSPQKRVKECLANHEQVVTNRCANGLTAWRVIAATRATA